MPLKTAATLPMKGGPKSSMSFPLKSALKKTSSTKPTSDAQAGPSRLGKKKTKTQAEEDEDEEADFDGDSNVSGFSDVEDVDMEDEGGEDEFDISAAGDAEEQERAADEESELDTDEEIDALKANKQKSRKNTKKRKAPTTEETFGDTLTALLAEGEEEEEGSASGSDAEAAAAAASQVGDRKRTRRSSPSMSVASRATTARTARLATQPILALSQKPLPPSAAKVSLERRAKRIIKAEKIERQDRARVRNVIEGWGPKVEEGVPGGQEWERGLRKVAQRGVVKLFNAINQAAAAAQPTSAAPETERRSKKEKDNVLGRGGKEDRLTKEGFLDMIKAGGR